MSSPPSKAVTAPRAVAGQVIAPQRMQEAAAKADALRKELHEAGKAEGKAEGLKIAGRYRDGALVCLGFVIGMMIGGLWVQSSFERGATTAAAVSNTTLQRVLPGGAPGPTVTAAEEYQRNAEAAREGCTVAQLRAGRRNCEGSPRQPADAPR